MHKSKPIQETVERLGKIIEHYPDGIYVVDGRGVTLLVNSAYEALSGTRREDLIGKHMADLIEKGYINQSVSLLVLEHKKSLSIMQNLKNGREVIVTGNPIWNEQGEIELVVTSVRDISQLNRTTRELERAHGLWKLHNHQFHAPVDGEYRFICKSPAMQKVLEHVKQVAPYPTSVLLLGPSGVGKEEIANLIHRLSNRADKPFIKVNCAAIPEHLLESELFGYEHGAFTGARREGKIGLFELADEGTILLDEIAEMSPALQAKLLRVLQDRRFIRIGGNKPRQVDVRVISSTNQNIRKLVQEGKFRADLYYRLQVVEISVPPLVDRPEDVEELMEYYFDYYCRKYRIHKRLSEDTKKLLQAYPWPGNVRELKNLMENLVVSVPSLLIEPNDLPSHIRHRGTEQPSVPLKERIRQYEYQIITEALQTHKSIRKTAQALGIDHSTLVKKLKSWRSPGEGIR